MVKGKFEQWDRHEQRNDGRIMVYIPGGETCVELKRLRDLFGVLRRKGCNYEAERFENDLVVRWKNGAICLWGFVYAPAEKWPYAMEWSRPGLRLHGMAMLSLCDPVP